ncbi:S-layer homology domain-containing protein [Deinococcus sp. S9]|uniref:S-layer homology domain-containing protein n=1 Tax=Deinococcus sp. S9 TaxID=2545754 RepID=UPI0010542AFB|nr:S-layer homology domain-containing protein [Deinococcus sp. S9]TDE85064.1 S-layer homology domain-containing protein [Deinococcus sp. S9]
MRNTLLLTLALTATLAHAQTAPAPATPPSAIVDVPAGHWAREGVSLLVQRGLILGYPDGTFRGGAAITRYEAAVIFARLLSQNVFQLPNVQAQLTPADLNVLAKAVQELAGQITTLNTRLTDVVSDVDSIRGRLGVVEMTLQQVVQVAATKTEVEAALAQSATKTELAAVQETSASKTDVQALEARIAALEAETKAALQPAAVAPPRPAELPNVTFRPDAPARYYAGGGVTKTLQSGLGFSGVVGGNNLVGGFGLRATVDYNSATQSYSIQANVIRPFGAEDALFRPYLGLGGGLLVSPGRAGGTTGSSDGFVSVLGGVNYAFTDTLKLFAEVDGHYSLSNKGSGTGLAESSGGGIGAGVRLGAQLSF